jgi:hypothetical protein
MTWPEFLRRFEAMPLFHSSMLEVFPESLAQIRVQLSRWVRAGKLVRIRREWYLIDKPWRAREIPPAYIATQIVRPSYLSLEWALEFHGLIPDAVESPTCSTTDRPRMVQALGKTFLYHHLCPDLLTGFGEVVVEGWPVPVASVEKALFDMIYFRLRRNRLSPEWLAELRLQNLEAFDVERFQSFAKKSEKGGLKAAALAAAEFIERERA